MADKVTPKFKEPKMSDRGFASFDPVADLSGSNTIKVFESSNAEHAAVWLSIEADPSFTDPGGVSAGVQLPLETVKLILQQLEWMVSRHYHNQPGPSA